MTHAPNPRQGFVHKKRRHAYPNHHKKIKRETEWQRIKRAFARAWKILTTNQ